MGVVQSKRKWREPKSSSSHTGNHNGNNYSTGDTRSTSSSTLQSFNSLAKPDPVSGISLSQRTPSRQSSTQTSTPEPPKAQNVFAAFQSNSYFLPKDWEVNDRHQALHFALKALYGDTVTSAVRQKFVKGARILDIECGNGFWIMDLATQYPECEFVGTAESTDNVPTNTLLPNVQFEIYTQRGPMPFEDNSVDVVHMRALGLSYTQENWSNVLREAYRILKPSGVVHIEEMLVTPTGTALIESFIDTVRNIIRSSGMNYDIALTQPLLLQNEGFQLVQKIKKKIYLASSPGKLGTEFTGVILRGFELSRAFLAPRMGLTEEDYVHRVEMVCAQCVRNDSHIYWFTNIGMKPSDSSSSSSYSS
ncbi:S-adenosyl-L-methionine-dependent methyltransferase [Phycomyces blakesleeanus]|uniref:S-adenosyl-L-methionine-dependent methyltransferase n=1 Tax=Phycomyces blakesleeanus TaxID=4837 RepID=A0ABR3BGC2_PHYBL